MSDNNWTAAGEESPLIPSRKMYFTISEVTLMTGVKETQLRHWEKEFSKLRPKKNSAGKRAYREKDIELIRRIKQLLEVEKYTMPGAKQKIAEERKAAARGRDDADADIDSDADVDISGYAEVDASEAAEPSAPSVSPDVLSGIRKDLQDVLALLES